MFPSPNSQSRLLFKSFMPAIFFSVFIYFLWRLHDRCSPGKFMIMSHHVGYYFTKTIPASYYIYTAWQRENELPIIYKKWQVIIFLKEIWVQAVGLPKSFISYLNFLIPDQTQPPVEKSIFQSFFFSSFFGKLESTEMKYAEMNVLYCLDRNLFTLRCFFFT